MKKFITTAMALATVLIITAQHQEVPDKPTPRKGKQNQPEDTTSLLYAFKRGQTHGYLRYYFMATDNASGLTDYYANAVGGGLRYETRQFHNFQFAVSGFYTFNIGSSNMAVPDPNTGSVNRYEIGLFDIEDPNNKKDIDRLGELYIKYNFKDSKIIFGKQLINTPFINLQDGRMRHTEAEGLWTEINQLKNIKIEGGFLYGIAPRSTVRWYKVDESIGFYPQGVNTDGTNASYKNNLNSKGIGLLGITYRLNKDLTLQVWELYAENIFNTLMIRADYINILKGKSKLYAGLQGIRQDAVNNGGNADPAKTYFQKSSGSQTFGARAGWKNDQWDISLNYNRITAAGRYLLPGEWGHAPFFTRLPRERNEGLGDVNAYLLKVGYSIPKARIKTQVGFGYYDLPEVTNFALNKYGVPSYTQLNIDVRYEFEGFLKGMESQLLYVYKGKSGNTYNMDKYVINKVNMSLWNMVLNYHF